MRNVQTQRLDDGRALCKRVHVRAEFVLGKQRARGNQFLHVRKALAHLVLSDAAACRNGSDDGFVRFFAVKRHHIECDVVKHMHRRASRIYGYVVSESAEKMHHDENL